MTMCSRKIAKAFLALFLFMSSVCHAQFSASVQGTVTDQSGASVPHATIVLANTGTNVTQNATSDTGGVYRFASLSPGSYTVTANAQGFSNAKVEFRLETAENRDVPIKLQVGNVTTSVEVTSQAALLDTSDSRLQYTLDTKALEDLPLSNRNPTALIGVTPGVTGGLDVQQSNLNNAPENFIDVGASGRGENGNEYVVDGLDVTSNVRPGVVNLTPGADSVQEVSVQTNTYTVEYGRGSGIQTIMTTKSGSDHFHGFASEYFTYQGFQARGEFGPTHAAEASLPPFHTNNAALGVGGPIWRSKKLFFFATYQPYHSGGANFVPTYFEDPAFVSFAQSVRPNSPELQLFKNPVTATGVTVYQTAAQAFGSACGTPAADNIPCTTPVLDTGTFNNAGGTNAKQYSARIDKYFSKDRLYGDFIRNTLTSTGPNPRPAFNTVNNYYGVAFQLNETHTFTPNLLNEGIFAFNRIEGIQPSQGLFTVPIVSVNGNFAGFGDGFAQGDYYQHSYHWRDVVTKIHGSHDFRFGYEGWHGDDTAIFQGPHGQATFNYTSLINLINDNPYSETGLSYNFQTAAPQPGNYGFSETTAGAFAQDTWKVKKGITLTYGVRYDNFGNPYPTLPGTIAAAFHLGSGNSFQQQIANGALQTQPNVLNHSLNWNFAPRAGGTWDVRGNGNWVVQAGFGIYHDQVTLGNMADIVNGNPPNFVVPTFFNDGSTAPPVFGFGTQNTFPYGFTYPKYVGSQLDAKGGVPGAQIGIGSSDVNLKSPTAENWSLGLEHSLSQAIVASVAYVGSHDGNILLAGLNQGGNAFGYDVNAFPGDLTSHTKCTVSTAGQDQCSAFRTRLNTSFGRITYQYNTARSNYDAFIGSVRGRFGRNAFFTASYTRSVSEDDASIYTPTASFDQNRFYGNSPYDVPNRVSVGGSYNTPDFHISNGFAERLAAGWTLGGTVTLQSGTPMFIYTGAPYAVQRINPSQPVSATNLQYLPGSGDFSASGYNYDLPNVTSNGGVAHSRQAYKSGVFPKSCQNFLAGCPFFQVPSFGQLGNERVTDQFRNPGFAQTDMSLHKNTKIFEALNLDLRLDAFNLFNRVNFRPVDQNAQDGSFGTASNGYHTPRYLQVGATFKF